MQVNGYSRDSAASSRVQLAQHPEQHLVVDLAGVAGLDELVPLGARASPCAAAGTRPPGSPPPAVRAVPTRRCPGARRAIAAGRGRGRGRPRSPRRAWSTAACAARCCTCASASASLRSSSPSKPILLITHGNVMPCSSSVLIVTTNAQNTMMSRPGTSGGIAAAAASVTTPRMPAQAITVTWPRCGVPVSRSRLRLGRVASACRWPGTSRRTAPRSPRAPPRPPRAAGSRSGRRR